MKSVCLFFAGVALVAAAESKNNPSPKIDDPRSVTVGERAVVPIYVCQFQNTLLILPTEELVRKSFVADTANWVLESTKGSEEASRYISIKVKEPLTKETALNVISDHDSSYTFRLILNSDHCDSKVSIDADSQLKAHIDNTKPWASPAEVDSLKAQVAQADKARETALTGAMTQMDAFRSAYPSKLKFDYHFDQKIADKMRIRSIFHDSKFTYVSADPQETPALYEIKDGKPSLIAFDFKDGLYSTGRIIDQGYLAVGGSGNGKHQEKLEFKRTLTEEN